MLPPFEAQIIISFLPRHICLCCILSCGFDIHMSVHRKYNSKLLQTKYDVSWFVYFYRRSTCFRRFLRPSSGTQNCTYNFRYCQPILQITVVRDDDTRKQQYWLTIPEAVCTVMCSWWSAEEPPETCTASVEINKSRKSHLVGCNLEISFFWGWILCPGFSKHSVPSS